MDALARELGLGPYSRKLVWVVILAVALPLLAPAIVAKDYFFPYVFPKALFIQAVVGLGLPAFVALLLQYKGLRFERRPLLFALSASLAVGLVSAIFAADPHRAFWGSAERMEGVFTLAHFFAWTLMAASLMRSPSAFRGVVMLAVLALLAVNLYGWSTFGDSDSKAPGFIGRYGLTYGNPAYLGEAQVAILFLLGLLAAMSEGLYPRLGLAVVALVPIYFMSKAGTRGSLLGLMVGLTVAGVAYALTVKSARVRNAVGGLTLATVGGYVAVAVFGLGRSTAFFQDLYAKHPSVMRLFVLVGPMDKTEQAGSNDARALLWEQAVAAFKMRPVLGWGPDNFHIAAAPIARGSDYAILQSWSDQSHNIFLDVLSMTGLAGVAAWVATWILFFVVVVRAYRRGQIPRAVMALLSGAVVAVMASKAVLFEYISSHLWTGLFLAIAVAIEQGWITFAPKDAARPGPERPEGHPYRGVTAPQAESDADDAEAFGRDEDGASARDRDDQGDDAEEAPPVRKKKKKRAPKPVPLEDATALGRVLAVGYLLAGALVYFTSYLPAEASKSMIQVNVALSKGELGDANRKLAKSWETSSLNRYDTVFALTAELASPQLVKALHGRADGKEFLAKLRTYGNSEVKAHPKDARLAARQGGFLMRYGVESGSQEIKKEALEAMALAADLAPARQDMVLRKGLAEFYLGDKERALATVRKACELAPDLGDVWLRSGLMVYMDMGDRVEASKLISKARGAARPATFANSDLYRQNVAVVAEAHANLGELDIVYAVGQEILDSPSGKDLRPQILVGVARAVEFASEKGNGKDNTIRDRLLELAVDKDPMLAQRLAPLRRGDVKTIDAALQATMPKQPQGGPPGGPGQPRGLPPGVRLPPGMTPPVPQPRQ